MDSRYRRVGDAGGRYGRRVIVERLEGERVVLRRARPEDAATVADIVASPGVVDWWAVESTDSIAADLAVDDGSFVVFLIEIGAVGADAATEVVGLVQFGVEVDPQYRHASIDIALRREHHRLGLGSDAIRTLVRHLFDDLGHHRVVIDPAAHNHVAIACYTSLGFRPVGVMRAYERGPDGTFHDGLLMDLLVGELR